MMNKKKTAVLLAAVLLSFSMFSAFIEPSPALWSYNNILQAENFGLLKDYSAGNFGPGDVAEKEHLAVMIYTALEKGGKLKSTQDFSSEYSTALTKYKIRPAAQKSVAYGWKYGLWSESEFAGPTAVTREMAAKWLVKASETEERSLSALDFKDAAAASGAYYRYNDTAVRAGLMQAGPDGGFHPELTMVRMEAASLCVGMYNYKAPAGGSQKTDITTVYGRVSDFDASTGSFLMQTEGGIRAVAISNKAKIIIDGKSGSLAGVQALSGKYLTVSCVECGAQTVIVQTKPMVLSGTVLSAAKKTDYTLLMINVGNTKIPYVITENTSGTRSFATGEVIKFIPDGCEIIEASN